MIVYRYKAVPLDGSPGLTAAPTSTPTSGDLAAESPAALRASLRRIGLQVIDARPARRRPSDSVSRRLAPLVAALHRHLRSRRVRPKAELYDSLATMLEAGLPVDEAVSTIGASRSESSARSMLVELREQLREGSSLDGCMERHAAWFDQAEIAMVRAARASGELPGVLRSLAERHERSGALSAKLVAALTYPSVVLCVGVGVVVFLSVKTLPDLVGILADAHIDPPRLTMAIMAVGQGLARYGVVAALCAVLLVGLASLAAARLRRSGWTAPARLRRLAPRAVRQTAVARAWSSLAELVSTGVPLVEALRITAPTVNGVVGASLASELRSAAAEIERGTSFADALTDTVWFDDECRRLIAIGENAGELPDILSRLAERTHRSAARSIDRFAALLEPAVILLLATAIGFVVIGTVLPILRLQEVIG